MDNNFRVNQQKALRDLISRTSAGNRMRHVDAAIRADRTYIVRFCTFSSRRITRIMVEDFYRISSLMFIQRLDLSLQCRIVKQIDALQEEVSTLATSLNFVNRILVVTGQSSIQAPLFLNSPEAEKFLLALQEADVVFRDLEYLEQVGHISRVGLKNILNPLRKRYQELQAILRTKRTLH